MNVARRSVLHARKLLVAGLGVAAVSYTSAACEREVVANLVFLPTDASSTDTGVDAPPADGGVDVLPGDTGAG